MSPVRLRAAGPSILMLKIGCQKEVDWNGTAGYVDGGETDSSSNEHGLGSNGGKRCYTLLQGHSGPVYSASFSPYGDFLLSSSSDSTIRLWSTRLNANLVCYKGHNYPVWDVQFSPAGHYFASSSHDRTARIWSMDRIQPLRIMAGHLSDVDCVQWHANCNYIATGSSDKTVRLWDVQSGDCVRIFIGHRGMILSLAMSSDGRYMASGDEDGTVMMWDLSSGRCITPLVGHSSCVWSLAFSGEGSLLASGSADCTVKLWDVTTSTKAPLKEENKSGSNNRLRSLKTLPTKATPVYALRMNVGYVNTYLMSLKCYGAVALVSLLIPEIVSVVIVTASAKAIFWEKFGVDFDYGADLTVSISRNVDLNDDLWFEIENSINVKFKDFKIPQNVYRALLEVYVSFHENDDF
ncbi:Transcription initiation factor TFIID subunit 5 [Capsicum annuum]|nr:Transcription initiation factor TFIID subunit 5 [Capsicum annuum]